MITLNQTLKELLTIKISILSLMKLKTFRGIMYLLIQTLKGPSINFLNNLQQFMKTIFRLGKSHVKIKYTQQKVLG